MMNYVRSERYLLLKKKSFYMLTLVPVILVTALAFVLNYSKNLDPAFPYGTNTFFYSNIIGNGGLIILFGLLLNLSLTGKKSLALKQSISFGTPRQTIFFVKFLLTLLWFSVLSLVCIMLSIFLGERLLVIKLEDIQLFFVAAANILPIVAGGFALCHVLNMSEISEVWVVVTVALVYLFSGDFCRVFLKPIPILRNIWQYCPSSFLNTNLTNFMQETVTLDINCWLSGLFMLIMSLLIGLYIFSHKDIV